MHLSFPAFHMNCGRTRGRHAFNHNRGLNNGVYFIRMLMNIPSAYTSSASAKKRIDSPGMDGPRLRCKVHAACIGPCTRAAPKGTCRGHGRQSDSSVGMEFSWNLQHWCRSTFLPWHGQFVSRLYDSVVVFQRPRHISQLVGFYKQGLRAISVTWFWHGAVSFVRSKNNHGARGVGRETFGKVFGCGGWELFSASLISDRKI